MKEIGVLVIGHAGIGNDMLDLLFHRLEHKKDFEVIVFQEYIPKNNKSSDELFEEFAFKNHYADIDFELKLAELDLFINTEKIWPDYIILKNQASKNNSFLLVNKEILKFSLRGVRPP